MRGPVPKREEERRRHGGKDATPVLKIDLDAALAGDVEIPAPPYKDNVVDEETGEIVPKPLWHPIAENAYLSLAKSGQAIFYEPSDWAFAYALCESLSREMKPKPMLTTDADGATTIEWVYQPVNGAVLGQFLKGWGVLMATEGDRRRLRIELDRKKARDAQAAGDGVVVNITQNRADIFG